MNSGFAVARIGANADLPAGEADGFASQIVNRHCHQGDRNLFTGREQHVHFTGWRLVADLPSQFDQRIGVLTHRAYDHHHLMALLLSMQSTPRRGTDLLSIGNTRTAKLLYY